MRQSVNLNRNGGELGVQLLSPTLMTRGKKLFDNLDVLLWMLQNLFPEASRKSRPWGGIKSLMMGALVKQCFWPMLWMGGSEALMVLSAVLTNAESSEDSGVWGLALSWSDQDTAGLYALLHALNTVRIRGERCAVLTWYRKCWHCLALLTRMLEWRDQDTMSIICTPWNIGLVTTSTALFSVKTSFVLLTFGARLLFLC